MQPMLGTSLQVFSRRWALVSFTPIVDDGFLPLTSGLVPYMLGAIATEMSFLVTRITFHFPYVLSRMSSPPSLLQESSSGCIGGFAVVNLFRSCKSSPHSSCRGVHGIWMGQLPPWDPSSNSRFQIAVLVCIHLCLSVNVLLLAFHHRFSPLLIGPWLVELEYF